MKAQIIVGRINKSHFPIWNGRGECKGEKISIKWHISMCIASASNNSSPEQTNSIKQQQVNEQTVHKCNA